MGIRAILFDLDDTLVHRPGGVDWERVTAAQAERVRRSPGAEALRGRDLEALVRELWEAFGRELPEPESPSEPPHDERRWQAGAALLGMMLRTAGIEVAVSHVVGFWEELFRVPPQVFGRHAFPDAEPALRELRARGFQLAVVTNRFTPAEFVVGELGRLGLHDHFTAVVTAGDVGYRKPHPAVFERALAEFRVAPHEAVMVGDDYELDVQGAARVGVAAIMKLNGRGGAPPRQTPAVRTLSELLAFDRLQAAGQAD